MGDKNEVKEGVDIDEELAARQTEIALAGESMRREMEAHYPIGSAVRVRLSPRQMDLSPATVTGYCPLNGEIAVRLDKANPITGKRYRRTLHFRHVWPGE